MKCDLHVHTRFSGMRGEHGSYIKLTLDVFRIGGAWISETRWAAIICPFAIAAPLITLAARLADAQFARKWSRELLPPKKSQTAAVPALQ